MLYPQPLLLFFLYREHIKMASMLLKFRIEAEVVSILDNHPHGPKDKTILSIYKVCKRRGEFTLSLFHPLIYTDIHAPRVCDD